MKSFGVGASRKNTGAKKNHWYSTLTLSLGVLTLLSACGKTTVDRINNVNNKPTSSSAIIGGTLVESASPLSKSIVAILDLEKGGLCTGSLLANNVVLSAAHCIATNPQTMILVFDVNAEKILSEAVSLEALLANPKVRRVQRTTVSSRWIAREKDFAARLAANPGKPLQLTEADVKDTGDISIITFVGSTPTGYVPAKLLQDPTALKKGTTVTLAGYGITNGAPQTGTAELRETKVEISDTEFSQTEIVLDQTKGHGACHGDSGGPAFVNINGTEYLWGITSRGIDDENDDCSKFSAYTNALAYQKSIDSVLAAMAPQKPPAAVAVAAQ